LNISPQPMAAPKSDAVTEPGATATPAVSAKAATSGLESNLDNAVPASEQTADASAIHVSFDEFTIRTFDAIEPASQPKQSSPRVTVETLPVHPTSSLASTRRMSPAAVPAAAAAPADFPTVTEEVLRANLAVELNEPALLQPKKRRPKRRLGTPLVTLKRWFGVSNTKRIVVLKPPSPSIKAIKERIGESGRYDAASADDEDNVHHMGFETSTKVTRPNARSMHSDKDKERSSTIELRTTGVSVKL